VAGGRPTIVKSLLANRPPLEPRDSKGAPARPSRLPSEMVRPHHEDPPPACPSRMFRRPPRREGRAPV